MPTPFDAQFWQDEEAELYEQLLPLFLAGLAAGMSGGTDVLPANLQTLVNPNVFNQAAIDYARDYRYGLIRDITETTRKQTQDAMVNWIQSGSSMDVLEQSMAGIFGESRAARIAATEATRAFSMGNQIAFESTGFITQVVWQTSQDERVCVVCESHDGEHLGVEDTDAFPPNASHPGCRCWVLPVVDEALVEAQLDEILGL